MNELATKDKPANQENGNKRLDWSNPVVAGACSPRLQELIILPTEQCNFRCTYCYEDFTIGAMKPPVQEGILRLLDNRVPDLDQLNLSWFGGEPLAARQIVLRIAEHAKELCDEHGVQLTGGLTTNAWHLDFALFEQLVKLDQNFFQITLDGWGAEHDLYRRKANGDGTFDRIWKNLLAFRKSKLGFGVQMRIHVRRESWQELKPLLVAIAENFGDDDRFTLDFEHIRNLGGEGGKTVKDPFSLTELKVVEKELRAYLGECLQQLYPEKFSHIDESIPELESEEPEIVGESGHAVCYASKANSLLIRADGRIGKCTVALTDERNTIGSLRQDGSLDLDNERLQPWIRGLKSLDPMELACPLIDIGHWNSAENKDPS